MIFQQEMDNFELALEQHSRGKEELLEAEELLKYELNEVNFERAEVRKSKERLQNEQENFKVAMEGYQENLTKLVEQLYSEKHTEDKMAKTTDKLTAHLLRSLEKVEKLQRKLETRINAMKSPPVCTPHLCSPDVGTTTTKEPPPHSTPTVTTTTTTKQDPIEQSIPVIATLPLPINTHTQHAPNSPVLTKADRSSDNGTMHYNDLSEQNIHIINSPSPVVADSPGRHVAFKHGAPAASSTPINPPLEHGLPPPVSTPINLPPKGGGGGGDYQFCNMKEHMQLKENIGKLRSVLQKHCPGGERCGRLETRESGGLGTRREESRKDMRWELCRLEAKVGDAVLKRSLGLLSDMHTASRL